MKSIQLLLVFLFLSSTVSTAQTVHRCAAVDVERAAIQKDPSILEKIKDLEIRASEFIQENAGTKDITATISIPIVIHIIHNGEPVGTDTNISDERIMLQIARLNQDYRKQNTDTLDSSHPYYPIQADCEIEFCLAQVDPEGNSTTGIYRYDRGQESWTINDIDTSIKPSTIWDRYNYMNIWSVNIDDPESPGVDGYGTFPASTSDTTDGVVVADWVFGSEDGEKSIVATHEVGHYLNLRHVWGDNEPDCGDDLVEDTPPSAASNEGCPTFPHHPNDACGTGPNGDIFMNYMDYSDAVCTVMFTLGQKARMQATLSTARSSLTTSNGCSPSVAINESVLENDFTIYPNPGNGDFLIDGQFTKTSGGHIGIYNISGAKIREFSINNLPYQMNLNDLPNGAYFIKLNTKDHLMTEKVLINN